MGLQADGILRINACLTTMQNLSLNRPILNCFQTNIANEVIDYYSQLRFVLLRTFSLLKE